MANRNLSDFTYDELINYLGLQEHSYDDLENHGVTITLDKANHLLEQLRELRFRDIRGHIAVNEFANISYSEDREGGNILLYDYFERTIRTSDAVININNVNEITFFLSSAKWIDFFFDINNVRITMVLVP